MDYIAKPIKRKQIITENKNNIKCDLHFETDRFNKLLSKYNLEGKFTIICAIADTAGFGDVIFFVKFTKYLIKQYPNIKINIVISKAKKEFIKQSLNPSIIYDDDIVEEHFGGNNNILMTVCLIVDDQLINDIPIDGDILFIAPKTNININLKYANPTKIKNNSYVLSEYNPEFYKNKGTINTGIQNKNTGLLINNYKNTINDEKEIYSIAYIYSEDQYMEEFKFSPSKIKFNIDNDNIWDLETLFEKLKIDIDPDILFDENYEDILYDTDEHYFIVKLKLALTFREYLNDLDNYTSSKIKIYYRGNSVDNIKDFISGLRKKDIKILKLKSLYNNLFHNDKFKFEVLPPKTHEEMKILYEHSLPIIFISGDQSITDFISLNKYYKEFKHGIYYQIFYWKQNFANSLGSKYYISFKITEEVLNKLSTNPIFDFRYKGMLYIHSLLLYALQYKLNVKNICKDLKSRKSIDKLFDKYKLPEFENLYKDYTSPENTRDNNLEIKIHDDILEIRESIEPFNIKMLLGTLQKDNTISWLMGTEVSEIYLKYNEYKNKNNIKFLDCNTLNIDVKENEITLPENLSILIVYILIEELRQSEYRDIGNNFVRTFGSFIIRDDLCNIKIKDKLHLDIKKNNINTLLIQENVIGKYITLEEYILSDKFDIKYLENIINNILYVVGIFMFSEYQIVHNDLVCKNIYLVFEQNPYVKIVNFDKASFTFGEKRFSSNLSTQKEFSSTYDIQTFITDIKLKLSKFSKELDMIINKIVKS